jgi:hypothetical protein
MQRRAEGFVVPDRSSRKTGRRKHLALCKTADVSFRLEDVRVRDLACIEEFPTGWLMRSRATTRASAGGDRSGAGGPPRRGRAAEVELAQLAFRIRRQVSHLEALEASVPASARPTRSGPPPAPNGSISRTGPPGNAFAAAGGTVEIVRRLDEARRFQPCAFRWP